MSAILLCTAASGAVVARPSTAHQASAQSSVVVTGVAADNSSAKIEYQPVPGAADYRVYDVSDPHTVKYAGIIHPKDSRGNVLSAPNTEIEWNRLSDGKPHTLVVQAVDQLGPIPAQDQYDDNNDPLVMPMAPDAMLGSNEGMTADGNDSINGQGPSTDTPHVIAQSAPFVVQANPAYRALPSRPDAQQTFFDTFDDGESLVQTGAPNPTSGTVAYSLGAGTGHAWAIDADKQDVRDSAVMVHDGHFMDVSFEGGTPGSVNPLHVSSSTLNMRPQATFDFSGGKVLHLTYEVDNHFDYNSHRWIEVFVSPASDPVTNFDFDTGTAGTPMNKTDTAVSFRLMGQENTGCTVNQFEGPLSASNSTPNEIAVSGALGQGKAYCTPPAAGVNSDGRGLDDRSRVDFFMSTTSYALFEDGALVAKGAWDKPLPFTAGVVDFAHYVYDTHSELDHLAEYQPYESYWRTGFQHSDERHWDNMGAEVLPTADAPADWSAFASLVQPPAFTAPGSSGGSGSGAPTATNTPVPPVATATATNTATPIATASATKTPVPPTATKTATPAATATKTATPAPPTSTPKPTNTPAPAALAFAYKSASASTSKVAPGSTETFNAAITANRSISNELVDFEVYNAAGQKVWQTWQSPTSFSAGVAHQFKMSWQVPQGQTSGAYTFKIGIFTSAWGFQSWNNGAATFSVGQ